MNTPKTVLLSVLFLFFWCVSARGANVKLIDGNWKGVLILSENSKLPFDVQIKTLQKKNGIDVRVINGKEDIALIY